MIKLEHVTKKYENICALDDFSYEFIDHKRTVIVGASGSGKSTLLKVIAQLEPIDSGTLTVDYKRLSFVFQNDMLLDHLNAFENIAYGINQKSVSKEELNKKVKEVASVTGCEGFLYQRTSSLSGGQRQRVSIARSLIQEPDILLMDEPFNSLDIDLKKDLMSELIHIQKKNNLTLIYVTHEPYEADFLGQVYLNIKNGKVV